MKVALLTWFHYRNYGTVLQVTALAKVIEMYGHTVHIVNYIPEGELNTLPDLGIIQYYGKKLIGRVSNFSNQLYNNALQEKAFEKFRNKYLVFTEQCTTYSDFQNLNEKYDVFVVGSDQIWAPTCFDPRYFLDFVNDSKRMIAYAPSVGLSVIKDYYIQNQIRHLAGRFQWISTREQSGSQIISKLIQKKVETVLDPTLLLNSDQWEMYIHKDFSEPEQPYLLAYFLGNRKKYWRTVYSVAQWLGLRVRIIPVFQNDLKREGCIEKAIGPEEFLYYCKNASFICTDSFHGTVFSINFHKEFLTFKRFKDKDKNNQNSRIYNILSMCGLENRLYKDYDCKKILTEKIDYSIVDIKRQRAQKASLEYLSNALASISNLDTDRASKWGMLVGDLCCGCGACKETCPTEAISMVEEHGFYKSFVDPEKCISCQRCKKVCPFLGQTHASKITDGVNYSYKDKDDGVLSISSSGGIAYRLAQKYLESDYAVVGCKFDAVSQTAKHILITPAKKENLKMLQGSKYMQSNFAEVIPEIMKCQLPMVIFGTPCQIAAIRRLIPKRQEVIYVDLICHGVPSRLLYDKYGSYLLRKCQMDPSRRETTFRYKQRGWREIYIYSTDQNVEYCEHQQRDLYFRMFELGNCYAETCYECRWRDTSNADLRIGDYWGEKFALDTTGVSMVIAMNDTGKKAIDKIRDYGIVQEQDIHDYEQVQQTKNTQKPLYYDSLMQELENPDKNLEMIIEKFAVPIEKQKRVRHKIAELRRFLGH